MRMWYIVGKFPLVHMKRSNYTASRKNWRITILMSFART